MYAMVQMACAPRVSEINLSHVLPAVYLLPPQISDTRLTRVLPGPLSTVSRFHKYEVALSWYTSEIIPRYFFLHASDMRPTRVPTNYPASDLLPLFRFRFVLVPLRDYPATHLLGSRTGGKVEQVKRVSEIGGVAGKTRVKRVINYFRETDQHRPSAP